MNNFITSLLGLNIYVYGLGVFVSIVVFLFLFWCNLRKTALNEEKLVDALFVASVFALIIGRLFFVFGNYDLFNDNSLKAFLLVAYPGVHEFSFWVAFLGYFLLYSLRKKYSFQVLLRTLFLPIIVSKLLLEAFAIIKEFNLQSVLMFVISLIIAAIYAIINKWSKNEKLKEGVLYYLALFISIPNFVIDFFKPGRVYFLGLNILTWEQVPYLVIIILTAILLILKLIKNRK